MKEIRDKFNGVVSVAKIWDHGCSARKFSFFSVRKVRNFLFYIKLEKLKAVNIKIGEM